MVRWSVSIAALLVAAAALYALPVAAQLQVSPAANAVIDQIYSGNTTAALESAKRLQRGDPQHPLGYLLEAEALWWNIWCTSAEFKYGMTYPRRRPKLPADQRYLDLATKVTALAENQLAVRETPEMHFYVGMGDALAARLYGLRWENRNTARAGVRAREHFLRAITLDPNFADADLGLGLYNYYVDTLSGIAKMLRFFMGIPGGSKKEGIRQLEHAIAQGVITSQVARFYLALNLHNYDREYERALGVIMPLVEKYPSNPLFLLARGDLQAKLGRNQDAADSYRAAASAAPAGDPECLAHVQLLARSSLQTLAAGSPSDSGRE